MSAPRSEIASFLDLTADETTDDPAPDPVEDDDFIDERERRRLHAVAEAEEIGLWCFITRQDDLAWLRLPRLQRDAMAKGINRAHRRR